MDPEKPSFPQRLWRETFGSKPAAAQYPDSSNVSQRVPKPIKELSSTSHGVKFVATHERFRSKVYDDGFGNRTIGYGHVLKPAENFPRGVSKSEALSILSEDMKAAETRVRRHVRIDLRDHEFDALTSFSFNAGYAPFREKVSPGKYRNTALLDFLNCGDRQKAADEFLKYNKATNRKTGKKEPVKELTERRKKEREMFLYGIYKHKEMPD